MMKDKFGYFGYIRRLLGVNKNIDVVAVKPKQLFEVVYDDNTNNIKVVVTENILDNKDMIALRKEINKNAIGNNYSDIKAIKQTDTDLSKFKHMLCPVWEFDNDVAAGTVTKLLLENGFAQGKLYKKSIRLHAGN